MLSDVVFGGWNMQKPNSPCYSTPGQAELGRFWGAGAVFLHQPEPKTSDVEVRDA